MSLKLTVAAAEGRYSESANHKKNIDEAGCLGAAMLAFSADTGAKENEIKFTHISNERTIRLNSAKVEIYENKFDDHIKIYPAI